MIGEIAAAIVAWTTAAMVAGTTAARTWVEHCWISACFNFYFGPSFILTQLLFLHNFYFCITIYGSTYILAKLLFLPNFCFGPTINLAQLLFWPKIYFCLTFILALVWLLAYHSSILTELGNLKAYQPKT